MNLIPYAQACAGSYDDSATPFAQDAAGLTHIFLSEPAGAPCFTFEGTKDVEEWLWRDFLVVGLATFEHPEFGTLHDGIAKGALGVVDAIVSYLSGLGTPALGWPAYDLAGHSKGAGELWIAAAELKRRGHPPRFCAAFESPHVGMDRLRAYLGNVDGSETATINGHGRDLVTQVPWRVEPLLRWTSIKDRIMLPVPDDYDMATKHRIPAVIAALAALPA